uniref:hypothetical protein n=1 Tax=Petrachloros mirabilis TaxID=2918835 RepID=UPI001EE7AFB2|nr:hypothetical protein [Petrachloros mirabilis]
MLKSPPSNNAATKPVPKDLFHEAVPQYPHLARHCARLGRSDLGDRTLLCLPAQSSGTWLAAAVLPVTDSLLANNKTLERIYIGRRFTTRN